MQRECWCGVGLRRQIGKESLRLKTVQLAVGVDQEIGPLRESFTSWNSCELILETTQSTANSADRGSDEPVLGGVRCERLAHTRYFGRQPRASTCSEMPFRGLD